MDNFNDFTDPGDLGFFDEEDSSHFEDEAEDFSEEGWAKDVEIVTNPDGSGSFKGTLKGMGF